MTARLFLGRPADHRWIDTDGYHSYRVPVPQPFAFEIDPDPLMPNDRAVTYDRRRYRHPAWRIVLTFYVAAGAPVMTHGTVMPGWVHGVELEYSTLCRRCRAREASRYWRDGLCFSCFAYEDEE